MQGLGYSLRPMASRGRPTKYHDRLTILAARLLAEKGYTNEQISAELEISIPTLVQWQKEYPDFSNAVKEGKAAPDDKVEASLYQRAVGFEYKAQKPMVVSLGSGAGSEIQYAEYTERVVPDVAAAFIWLKNRRPEKWRDKHEVSVDTAVEVKVSFDPRGL